MEWAAGHGPAAASQADGGSARRAPHCGQRRAARSAPAWCRRRLEVPLHRLLHLCVSARPDPCYAPIAMAKMCIVGTPDAGRELMFGSSTRTTGFAARDTPA